MTDVLRHVRQRSAEVVTLEGFCFFPEIDGKSVLLMKIFLCREKEVNHAFFRLLSQNEDVYYLVRTKSRKESHCPLARPLFWSIFQVKDFSEMSIITLCFRWECTEWWLRTRWTKRLWRGPLSSSNSTGWSSSRADSKRQRTIWAKTKCSPWLGTAQKQSLLPRYKTLIMSFWKTPLLIIVFRYALNQRVCGFALSLIFLCVMGFFSPKSDLKIFVTAYDKCVGIEVTEIL